MRYFIAGAHACSHYVRGRLVDSILGADSSVHHDSLQNEKQRQREKQSDTDTDREKETEREQ